MPHDPTNYPAYSSKQEVLDHLVTVIRVPLPHEVLKIIHRLSNTDTAQWVDPVFEHPETNS